MSKKVRETSDAEIEAAFDRLAINSQREANKAVNRAARLYAGRLKQNAPRDAHDADGRHSADYITVKNAKMAGLRPEAKVGFTVTKELGWYMHFPDGGTTVRGTLHQPAQNFVEKTIRETQGPALALFKQALRKASGK